ncbi:hypothetical protein VZT92_010604 [Zoarces viviparus]|uniref:Uncharacterized protein n=1 Tax=Zoarces viviparus TaxID=48416 RepID=A0AAW1F9V0_ZOAVI
MEPKRNKRGILHHEFENQHLKLEDLKRTGVSNGYLGNEIPEYPHPEFHVCRLKHDTDKKGLYGIRRDKGFKNLDKDGLLWWGLDVGSEEITSAETKLLETTYPDRTEEQAQKQQSFLGKFATSPAFKRTSRLGSYRFTFPLEEVLKAYSEKFCSGEPPVMRVFVTHLYKKEVMYAVLVHSPDKQEEFSRYPLLANDPNAVCAYEDGCFIWRSEAMCDSHTYELDLRHDENQMAARKRNKRFYVWDNVALALHVDKEVLKFKAGQLRKNLKFCEAEKVGLIPGVEFEDFSEAEEAVKELWPNNQSPLEKDE